MEHLEKKLEELAYFVDRLADKLGVESPVMDILYSERCECGVTLEPKTYLCSDCREYGEQE